MIVSVELENFRNYRDVALPFSARMLLIGPNGSGKSTVPDAIAWCLTGRCRGVNAKGEGQKDLIRHGADTATVRCDMGNGWVVSRSISRNGSTSCSMKTEQILGRLGVSEGMLLAIIYGQTFFDLHHADAKAMLMQALNVRVPKVDLPGVDLGEAEDAGLDEIEELYKAAFTNRADVKRQLAAVKIPDRPKVLDMALAGKSADALAEDIKEDRKTAERLVAAQTKATSDLDRQQQDITAAEHAAVSRDKVQGTKTAHEAMLGEHQGQLAAARDALTAAEALPADPVDQLTVQASELEVLIDKLTRHDPDRGCVLSAAIPCLTKASAFTGQVTELQKTAKGLTARVKASQARAAAIAAAQQSVTDGERNVAYHQGQIEDADLKLSAADEANRKLKGLRAALKNLKADAAKASDAVVGHRATADLTVQQWQAVVQHASQQAAYQAAMKQKDDLTAKVAKAEALVKLLGPSGARVPVLSKAIGEFNRSITTALEPFGFAMQFEVDPWQVFVQEHGVTESTRFEMLSKGERLWTALAFQLALAKVAGLGFAMIDDVEAVVGDARRLLTQAVMTTDLDQVMVLMAKPDNEPAPALDGLQVIRVTEVQAAVA